jgi:hypothetical protein
MRYEPSSNELSAMAAMPAQERLHYFLTRSVESEEIWGLGDGSGWVVKEVDGRTLLPVWPYRVLAGVCAEGEWEDQVPSAVSLEHFLHHVLKIMMDQDIQVEVLPTTAAEGEALDAGRLLSLFESMLDSGEYFLEG